MKGEGRMLNGIWMAMIVLAFVGAVCTGRWTALSAAAADGARQAVETVLLLLGAMCLWTGIMRIAGGGGAYKRAFQNSVAGHQAAVSELRKK